MNFKTGSGSGGKREKHITVTTNDPEQKTVSLTVKTEVVEAFGITPIRINFNQVKRGQEHIRFTSVSGEDKDATKLTGAESPNPNIKVEINSRGFDGEKYQQIKVILLPTMKTGRFFERVTIHTSHKTIKDIQLNVIGAVIGDITIAPNQIHFGFFQKDKKPSERFLTIRSAGEATFKILEVTSSIPEVTTRLETVVDGKEYKLRAALNDTFAGASLNGKLTIKTDLLNDGIIEVPIAGRVLPPTVQQPPPATIPPASQTVGETQPSPPGQ